MQRTAGGVTLGLLALQSGVVELAGSKTRRPRGWLVAISLVFACVCACSDTTHTVGALSLERGPTGGTNAQAGRTGNGASSAGSGGSLSPGDVGVPDGGRGDAGPALDPILMVGEPAFSCRGEATETVRRRLDLFLMVDTNLFYSVGTALTQPIDGAWLQIARGLSEYVDDPRASGTGVGVGYFPALIAVPGVGPACDKSSYSRPAAGVMPLPGNADAIKRSFPPPLNLSLGSPTLPALEGAFEYARSRFSAFPYKQAVVLVTDNLADFSCSFEPNMIVEAAAASAAGDPPIPTYVIALSSSRLELLLRVIVPFEQLDAIAAEGGTGHARSLNLEDPRDSLAAALNEIQRDAEPCQYEVTDAVRADPTATALGTLLATGKDPRPLPRLNAAKDCGQGYYFDDPAMPKWATLCSETCTALKASTRTVVWIDECDMP